MSTQTTHDIKVSVNIFYKDQYSEPQNDKHFFAYRVTIENNSEKSVQVLSRRWQIFDSSNGMRKVEGEGVIGEQPVIAPGKSHEYVSWCPLKTEIGRMSGTYLVRCEQGEKFRVKIPELELVASYRMN